MPKKEGINLGVDRLGFGHPLELVDHHLHGLVPVGGEVEELHAHPCGLIHQSVGVIGDGPHHLGLHLRDDGAGRVERGERQHRADRQGQGGFEEQATFRHVADGPRVERAAVVVDQVEADAMALRGALVRGHGAILTRLGKSTIFQVTRYRWDLSHLTPERRCRGRS